MMSSDLGKGAFLLFSGTQYLGLGFRFMIRGRTYVATARHVFEKLTLFGTAQARWRTHEINLPTLVKIAESEELDFVVCADNLALGVLGCGVAIGKPFSRGLARITGSSDGGQTYVSVGVVGFGVHQLELLHGSSTMSGWSGAPIYNASGNVIGLHCGFDAVRGKNYGVPIVDIMAQTLARGRLIKLGKVTESWDDYEQEDINWGRQGQSGNVFPASIRFYTRPQEPVSWSLNASEFGAQWADDEEGVDFSEPPKFQENAVLDFPRGTVIPHEKTDQASNSSTSTGPLSNLEVLSCKDTVSLFAPPTLAESVTSDLTGLTKSQIRNRKRATRRKLQRSSRGATGSSNSPAFIVERQEPVRQIPESAQVSMSSFQNSVILGGPVVDVPVSCDPSGTMVPSINPIEIGSSLPPVPALVPSVSQSKTSGRASWRKPTPFEKLTFMATGLHQVETWRQGQEGSFKIWQDRAVEFPERFERAYMERLQEVTARKRDRRHENALLNRTSGF
jgi:hypothetical protein